MEYEGHKCSEPGCDSRECACMVCHKCQSHHDKEIKIEGGFKIG